MPILFRDSETCATLDLNVVGAWRYAVEPTTEVLCVGYAVDDRAVNIWTPGQAIPEEFFEAAHDPNWLIVAHADAFETALEQCLLGPRYGWPQIRIERHRCTMAMALSVALPGSLEGAAAALALPFQKDRDGARLMRQLARRVGKEPNQEQLERLYQYCRRDVEAERGLFYHLPQLPEAEQALWLLDFQINARGFHIDRPLAEAARKLTAEEQNAIDQAIAFLTNGEITSANQVARIRAFVEQRGQTLKSLSKRSVSAVLEHRPKGDVSQLLELRRDGSRAAARKLDALLAGLDEDNRLRGTLRFHGAATGRWSGSRFQPQNLKKPETTKDIDAAVGAILAGDMPQIRKLGTPLAVVGDISRAMICAAPGHILIGADFSAIESRVLAWIAGEKWKLDSYRRFDASQDPAAEVYCKTASLILRRSVTPDDEGGRTIGKTCDLSFGYGGGLGAYRRFDTSGNYSDAAVEKFKLKWRSAHKATVQFWHALESGLRRTLRIRQRITLGNLAFEVLDHTLYIVLPSGRRLAYPEARLDPGKFAGTEQIVWKDNARGSWNDARGWHGTFTENVVQAISRDLLAAAMQRLETAGYAIVLHVHDEVVAEVPEDFGRVDQFVQLMTTLPDWAAGLPIAAKGWRRQRYAKPAAGVPPRTPPAPIVEEIPTAPSVTPELETGSSRERIGSLAGLFGPLVNGKVHCPFHSENTPSCHVYDDGHFHCFGCGAHGDAVDWLRDVEGMTYDAAMTLLAEWQNGGAELYRNADGRTLQLALGLWSTAEPIISTLAVKYLSEIRGIDMDALPADAPLRFHPRCLFGHGLRVPALIALYRDVVTDEPAGIHRIALTPEVFTGAKVQRLSLGRWPAPRAIKLWPATDQLFVGEGLETVLAAATRLQHRGAPMRPAWAAGFDAGIAKLPIIPGVNRLLILVDHDLNGMGQAAAQRCSERWSRAGKIVVRLMPKQPGADFNDIVGRQHE